MNQLGEARECRKSTGADIPEKGDVYDLLCHNSSTVSAARAALVARRNQLEIQRLRDNGLTQPEIADEPLSPACFHPFTRPCTALSRSSWSGPNEAPSAMGEWPSGNGMMSTTARALGLFDLMSLLRYEPLAGLPGQPLASGLPRPDAGFN